MNRPLFYMEIKQEIDKFVLDFFEKSNKYLNWNHALSAVRA